MMANGDTVVNTHTCRLPLGSLPTAACEAHVTPNITPLLSIGQLCDEGCTAVFPAQSILIFKDKSTLMKGYRDKTTNLWHIPIAQRKKQEHVAKYVKHGASPSQLVSFAHATFFPRVQNHPPHLNQTFHTWLSRFDTSHIEKTLDSNDGNSSRPP